MGNGEEENASLQQKWCWEVEFSRFFNFPLHITASSAGLKPLSKIRTRSKGTWLVSSSPSSSCIASLTVSSDAVLILSVSLSHYLLEEHFISDLHFSWPQVSCTTDCPTRGSRVVFASYKDCHDQIQKFVFRFSTGKEAQAFLDTVKKNLTDTLNPNFPRSDSGCENLTPTDYSASNALPYRTDENSNFTNPDVDYHPEMPIMNFQGERHASPQQSLTISDSDIFSALPPAFTALLADSEKEPPKEPEEVDLKSQISRYLLDSSFHEMVMKVEKVIADLGGGFTL